MYKDELKGCFGPVIMAVVLVVVVALIGSTKTIRQGEVGVVTRFGKATGREMEAGLNWKAPFIDSVVRMDTKIKKVDAEASAGTKDLQVVTTKVALNYHINSSDASDIFSQLGDDDRLYETVINPAIQEVVKATFSQYKAEELLTKREEVKLAIDEKLTERLVTYWVHIDDISLTDIDFSAEFNAAIESKQVAEQEAQKANYEADKALTQKQAEVDKAKLDVEKAKAIAEQNKIQTRELSDRILQKMWIEKWNGVLPTVVSDDTSLLYTPAQ